MIVRIEEPEDRPSALEVERLAFGSDEEPAIVEAIRDEEGSFALVALEDGEVVGHVQFSRGWIGEEPVLALGPLAVRPERQRRGTGSELVRLGLEEARRRGAAAVIVLGSPDLYRRFGFEPASRFEVPTPYPELPEEDFMVLYLQERGRPGGRSARYHPAFG